jgi:hypothetical protein
LRERRLAGNGLVAQFGQLLSVGKSGWMFD